VLDAPKSLAGPADRVGSGALRHGETAVFKRRADRSPNDMIDRVARLAGQIGPQSLPQRAAQCEGHCSPAPSRRVFAARTPARLPCSFVTPGWEELAS
jgi:hypothetical protein